MNTTKGPSLSFYSTLSYFHFFLFYSNSIPSNYKENIAFEVNSLLYNFPLEILPSKGIRFNFSAVFTLEKVLSSLKVPLFSISGNARFLLIFFLTDRIARLASAEFRYLFKLNCLNAIFDQNIQFELKRAITELLRYSRISKKSACERARTVSVLLNFEFLYR